MLIWTPRTLVAITAQVMRSLIGRGAFRNGRIRHDRYRKLQLSGDGTRKNCPASSKEAFYIASTGRPGPCADGHAQGRAGGRVYTGL